MKSFRENLLELCSANIMMKISMWQILLKRAWIEYGGRNESDEN